MQISKSCPMSWLTLHQGELFKRQYLAVTMDSDENNVSRKANLKLMDPRDWNAFVFFIWYFKWAQIKCSSDMLREHCAGCVQIWAVSCSDFSLFVFSFHKLAYFPVKTSHLKYLKCFNSAIWVTGEQGRFCLWTQTQFLGDSWQRCP